MGDSACRAGSLADLGVGQEKVARGFGEFMMRFDPTGELIRALPPHPILLPRGEGNPLFRSQVDHDNGLNSALESLFS